MLKSPPDTNSSLKELRIHGRIHHQGWLIFLLPFLTKNVNIIYGPKCFKIDTVTCILITKLCFRYTVSFLSQKLNLVLELLIIWTLFYLGPNRVHYTATPGGPGSGSRNSLEHLYFQNGKICKFHFSFFSSKLFWTACVLCGRFNQIV